jgi:hypothetical protein
MAYLLMLVSWEILKGRGARVLQHHANLAYSLTTKTKEEARLWSIARAKALSMYCWEIDLSFSIY